MKYKTYIHIFPFIILLMYSISIFAQEEKFYIGIATMDFDSVSTFGRNCGIGFNQSYPGENALVGHDQEYLEILANDNINLIIPYHHYLKPYYQYAAIHAPSTAFLDRALKLGIDVFLYTPDILVSLPDIGYDAANSAAALSYYGSHPAIKGWHVSDEPRNFHFGDIASYYTDIENYNPDLIRFSNLLPMWTGSADLGFSSGHYPCTISEYESYFQQYITQTNPNFLSHDYYPFALNSSRYFYNNHYVGQLSAQNDIPFFAYIQPVIDPNCDVNTSIRALNKAEFGYNIFGSLIHGAKGLFYWPREGAFNPRITFDPSHFAFTTKGGNYWDNLIDTNVKSYLRELHRKLLDHQCELLSLEYKYCYHYSNESKQAVPAIDELPPNSSWNDFKSNPDAMLYFDMINPVTANAGTSLNPVAISLLENDAEELYFWLMNKSITNSVDIDIHFSTALHVNEVLEDKICFNMSDINVQLDPGEAKLFHVTGPASSNNILICNANYGAGSGFDRMASTITLGGSSGTCNVIYNGVHKGISYKANQITIGPNTHIVNSKVHFQTLATSCMFRGIYNRNETSEESEIPAEKGYTIYPNPSYDLVNIDYAARSNIKQVALFDITGKQLVNRPIRFDTGRIVIDVQGFPPGVYTIHVDFEDAGDNFSDRFIVSHQ